jgi:7-cyano-7-deazaguanine synthase
MDSIAVAYWKRPEIAITVDYGQKPAQAEIQASSEVCRALGIEHLVLRIDCSAIGSGDLAGTAALPMAPASEWWPFRNQLLVTIAAARVLSRGVNTLLLGTVESDRIHADGTPQFVAAISTLLSLQEGNIRLDAPAIELSSASLVRTSGVPIEILAWAHSCHVSNLACGRCRGCAKHFATMKELDIGPY